MWIRSISQPVFAATMIGLGILGFVQRDFTVIWAPVPKTVPAREALIYFSAFVSVASGLALFWHRTAPLAARALLGVLVLWLLAFRLPALTRSLAVDSYWAMSSLLVMVAAACVLAATSNTGVRVARALFGLAIIPFGIAHFQYIQNTASLVPAWLPAHTAAAYLTGAAFVAAGLAILTGVCGHLAATLAAWQMGLFLLLVWIPRVAAGSVDDFQRGETVVSWVLTAAAWVVADSYASGTHGPSARSRLQPYASQRQRQTSDV